MKKLLALAFTVLMATALLANGEKTSVPSDIKRRFQEEFPGMVPLSWTKVGNYWVAGFKRDNYQTNAYFNERGTCVGYGRYLKNEDVPLLLTRMIASSHSGWATEEVFEYSSGRHTCYFIVLKKERERKVVFSADLVNAITVNRNGVIQSYSFPWEGMGN